MPKIKSRKGIAKRFRLTGSGKVTHGSGGNSHMNRKKSKSQLRRLRIENISAGKTALKIKKLLGK